jgi:SPP1 gp7 family putative phage head morphogenesis protein
MMLDEQVKAVVKFKRDAITSRDHFFEFTDDVELSDAEAEKRIDIYNKMISSVRGTFNDGLNYIMSSMYQGYSFTEIVLGPFEFKGTPYIGIDRLTPKPYETFEFLTDKFGQIEETVQELDSEKQTIDLSKFVYFVHNPEFDRHYGQSDLREAYRSWISKDTIIKLQNIFLERMAGGFISARPKEGTVLKAGSRDYEAIKAVISNLQSSSAVLLPSNIEMELHSITATDAFEKAITMHDLQIAKALLVPNLLGVTHQGDTGSYAQASTQLEAFLWTLDSDANRLADAVNEQVFDPLSIINFADGIGPKLKFKPVSEEKKLEIIKVWKDLVQSGAVEPTDTDEEHLRDLIEFPEKGEPIKEPAPVIDPSALPGSPSSEGGDTEPTDDDETVVGQEQKRIVSNAAFTRAMKRVSFAVIDRKSIDLENRHTDSIEKQLGDMLANTVVVIQDEKLGTPAGTIESIAKLDFNTKDKTKTRRAIDTSLKEGWRLGIKHSRDEVGKAKRDATKLDMARIDEDAAEFLRTNGFRMMGNLTDDMRKIIQNVLMNGVKFSWTTNEIVNKIYDSLTTSGFLFMKTNTEATARSADDVLEALQEAKLNAHRVRTAVRTNTFEAINEARYAMFTDPELDGFVEALEYSAILDDRTTEICTHLDGRIYPADSEQWNSIRPPNHFNCRSILVPVTVVDTDVTGKDKLKDSRWSKAPRKEPQKGFGGTTG